MRLRAHFCMPNAVNGLPVPTIRWVEWNAIREALRARRNALGLTLDGLAATAKINRATIHSIENIKREPDLQPEIETIERLGGAMGLVLQIRLIELGSGTAPAIRPDHAAPPPHSSAADELAAAGTAILRAAHQLRSTESVTEASRERRRSKTGRSRRSP